MHFSRYRSVHFDRGTVLLPRCIPPFVVPDFVNAHYRSHKIDHGTNLLLAVSATGGARKRYTGGARKRTPLSGVNSPAWRGKCRRSRQKGAARGERGVTRSVTER